MVFTDVNNFHSSGLVRVEERKHYVMLDMNEI